jgi:hypothetical protein
MRISILQLQETRIGAIRFFAFFALVASVWGALDCPSLVPLSEDDGSASTSTGGTTEGESRAGFPELGLGIVTDPDVKASFAIAAFVRTMVASKAPNGVGLIRFLFFSDALVAE